MRISVFPRLTLDNDEFASAAVPLQIRFGDSRWRRSAVFFTGPKFFKDLQDLMGQNAPRSADDIFCFDGFEANREFYQLRCDNRTVN